MFALGYENITCLASAKYFADWTSITDQTYALCLDLKRTGFQTYSLHNNRHVAEPVCQQGSGQQFAEMALTSSQEQMLLHLLQNKVLQK